MISDVKDVNAVRSYSLADQTSGVCAGSPVLHALHACTSVFTALQRQASRITHLHTHTPSILSAVTYYNKQLFYSRRAAEAVLLLATLLCSTSELQNRTQRGQQQMRMNEIWVTVATKAILEKQNDRNSHPGVK